MLLKRILNGALTHNHRWFCVSTKANEGTIIIQQTTYNTDDWTDIKPRFKPFVGVNLYQKRNHPLRRTEKEIEDYFKTWFQTNGENELSIFSGTDPIEVNALADKKPNTFYVNRDLVLRTDTINREIKYLKSGLNNFLLVADLYRRCEMSATHFPVFHRVNVFRTMECDQLTSEIKRHLENEQKSVLIDAIKHLMGSDLEYRWIDTNWTSTYPSWALEIFQHNEWHRVCGTGLIRNEIFAKAERSNIAGWEIGIGLDRLTMILNNIFDIRMLWNSDIKTLNQFATRNVELNKETKTAPVQNEETSKTKQPEFETKKQKLEMQISYVLPEGTDLESFPTDALCEFIKNEIGGIVEKVEAFETYFHPKYDTYCINIRVTYKKQKHRKKSEIKCLHESARAQAAHKFNLMLRL